MDQQHRLQELTVVAAFAVGAVILTACSSGVGEVTEPTTLEAEVGPTTTTGSADAGEETLVATYRSATVYAAATDYFFEDAAGQPIDFRVSNLPEEQDVDLPPDMLDSTTVEGPPGANPDLVGREFVLVYNDERLLVRVEIIE